MAGDMMKGGLRYKRLKKAIRAELEDEGLVAFFIGTAKELDVGRLLVGKGATHALTADEHLLAVTSRAVYVFEMGGMGVFSAKLEGRTVEMPLADATATISDGVVTLNGQSFHVFPWHDEDAEAFVRSVTAGGAAGA